MKGRLWWRKGGVWERELGRERRERERERSFIGFDSTTLYTIIT